ncbi:MAG: tryptophan--tRNA ligase [Ruminococcaceae bacterium]|nr:tryptophan--tRNA ligase [Oscillospiraceae bacterium]
MENEKKKVIFSGIQPTGCITLGNYIGALKNWVELQNDYNCLFSVVDLHSITVRQDPVQLRKRCVDFLVQYLACGINGEDNLVFFQSHVPQHAELSWILNCYTYMGELSRMTQFKDKSSKHADNINAGLFTYPVLMAADILLYQTDLVPVGNDQKQHLELARDIAIRFNGIYGDTFTVPEGFMPKAGARIMSLQEPTSKMSKSDPNENGFISILDRPDAVVRKIKRAVTDSDNLIKVREGHDGINNLITIYSAITKKSNEEIEAEFDGKGYGDFKMAVAEAIIEELKPIQQRYDELIKDKAYIEQIYTNGAKIAQSLARRTLSKVHRRVGFVDRKF